MPTNAEENGFIFNAAQTKNARNPYIGLFRVDQEKNMFNTTYGTEPSYKNWGPCEPNNYRGKEDCAALLTKNGKWNDVNCLSSRHFVCEINV